MPHTVKQVASLSGVSVRTLHFYDEIGLLKPACTNAAGYRFYEQPQLLRLQQILFYRELGMKLSQIKQILSRPGFRKTAALRAHRKVLEQKITRTHRLIQTIDKTTQHLKGKRVMQSQELFEGFSLPAGGDRFGQPLKLGGPAGEPIDCKLSAKDTNGALCVFEFTCNSGGPECLHFDQDEWIYLLEGQFEFHVGKKQFRAGPGECIFIPRNVPHVFARVTDGSAPSIHGKILNAYQPAGKMEDFFREVAKYDGKPAIHEALGLEGLRRFFSTYGMKLTGPPLGWKE